MSVIFNQEVIMLLLIFLGFICFKINLITEEGRKTLSSLVLTIVNPTIIFMAYQKDFETKLIHGLLISFALSAAAFGIAIAVSYLLLRSKNSSETDIERFSAVYSNCGFMGIPLVNALFGSDGVFYLTAFLTMFNLLTWTHGVIQISGVKSFKSAVKAFKSPAVIAIGLGLIFFIFRIKLPSLLSETLEYISAMNTPLAMMSAGASIAQADLIHAIKNKRIYWVSAVKLVVIPALLLLLFLPLPVDRVIKFTVIIAMAAPSAAMGTLFCIRYNKNSCYASEIFAMSTILSMATLPLVMMFDRG